MKINQPPRNCGNCRHIVTDRYETPVCYQLKEMDGKPVAVAVKRSGKAYQGYGAV